jgi:hypothetical protein
MKSTLAALLTLFLATSLSFAADNNVKNAVLPVGPNPGCSSCGAIRGCSSCGAIRGCSSCGNPCQTQGCLLYKVLVWATYRPKEHVCSCTQWCNSCGYKGLVPPYLYFQNPRCVEGSGIAPTFANTCSSGCRSCAHP